MDGSAISSSLARSHYRFGVRQGPGGNSSLSRRPYESTPLGAADSWLLEPEINWSLKALTLCGGPVCCIDLGAGVGVTQFLMAQGPAAGSGDHVDVIPQR
jgi:hypothetical protein